MRLLVEGGGLPIFSKRRRKTRLMKKF